MEKYAIKCWMLKVEISNFLARVSNCVDSKITILKKLNPRYVTQSKLAQVYHYNLQQIMCFFLLEPSAKFFFFNFVAPPREIV